jgi:cobalt-zinc-cadmium efflux system membrane fusion protein
MKTRTILSLFLLALLLLGGCRNTQDEAGHAEKEGHAEAEPHEEAGEPEHEEGEGEEDNLVRIAPEMLRDLKLTTAKAEAREAKQRVSALGELKVNENAYAAVSPPIPARIVSLRAEPGQGVRAGQVLAELQSL